MEGFPRSSTAWTRYDELLDPLTYPTQVSRVAARGHRQEITALMSVTSWIAGRLETSRAPLSVVRYLATCGARSSGLLCDLLWSDPEKEISGWGENDRGVSFTFGQDVVHNFLRKHDLDLICRAHQVRTVF